MGLGLTRLTSAKAATTATQLVAPTFDVGSLTATAVVPSGASVTMLVNGTSVGSATVSGTTANYTFATPPAANANLAMGVTTPSPSAPAVYTGKGTPGLTTAYNAASAANGNPQTAPLASNIPTVSYNTLAPSAQTPAVAIATQYPATATVAGWQAAVDLDGGLPIVVGGNLNMFSVSQGGSATNWTTGTNCRSTGFRMSFRFTGTDFAFRTVDGGTNTPRWFRILVNGQYTSRAGYQASPGSTTNTSYVTVTFPTALAGDLVTIETTADMVIAYLLRRTTDTMSKPVYSFYRPTILIIGDSISAGGINDATTGITKTGAGTTSPAFSYDSVINRALDLLGCRRINNSIGGTGYISGSAGTTDFLSRLFTGGDLAALMPLVDGAIFLGGMNDAISVNNASNSLATVQARINQVLAQTAAGYPSVPIAVGGTYYNSSFTGAGTPPTSGANVTIEAAIQSAVAAAKAATPAARIGFFNVNNILDGQGAPPTTGKAANYLNNDATHPNSTGEAYESPIVAPRSLAVLQAV